MNFPTILWVFLFSTSIQAEIKPSMETLLFIGDSIGEGFGVGTEKSFVAVLEKNLRKKLNHDFKILNGSVSGATSASALSRLKWYERENPSWVILELGGNDLLRGIQPSETRKNLRQSIEWCQQRKIRVLLMGMKVPLNYGNSYRKEFESVYPELSRSLKVPLVPYLLEGVGGISKMNQSDGIHPNEMGHEKIALTLEKKLLSLLKNKGP